MAAPLAAAPVAVVPPGPLVSGFQVDWVHVDVSPHTIADAQNALAGTGGFTVLGSHSEFRPTIDLDDGTVPFPGADRLAVRITGYVELAAGDYRFAGWHDDGMRLTIGGEHVIVFDSDTSPTQSVSALYSLAAGVYTFEAISWEQGGQFELELGILNAAGARELLPGFHVAANDVPEPATLALAGLALLGVAGISGRRR